MNIYAYTYALYTYIPYMCTYIHIITIREQRGHEFEKEWAGIYERM